MPSSALSAATFVRSGRFASCLARVRPALIALAVLAAVAVDGRAANPPSAPSGPSDDFSRQVQLAPFAVRGQKLAISIHARNARDRRYAEEFSLAVLKVVHESVTESTGKGLVIIGAKGEPHPIHVFRRFLALAEAGRLDPAIAARGPELAAALTHWEDRVNGARTSEGDGDSSAAAGEGEVDLEFERIVTALPLPLQGVGTKIYQLAWAEKFDSARVDARLRDLRAGDLERDLFTKFDWVFYLPPRNAFDRVLDELIAAEMKEDQAGLFERMAVKTVMLAVRPKIRHAIDGVRSGLLFHTIVEARTELAPEESGDLLDAYVNSWVADKSSGPAHDRLVRAVRERLAEAKTTAKDDARPERAPANE